MRIQARLMLTTWLWLFPDIDTRWKEFRKESMIWCQLKHPNILPLYGIDESVFRPRPAMVSPWMKNGNVLAYLKVNKEANRGKIVRSPTTFPHSELYVKSSRCKELRWDCTTCTLRIHLSYMVICAVWDLHLVLSDQLSHYTLQTNVLIDDSGAPRLADFGLSRILDSKFNIWSTSSFKGNGSMRWQAPELLYSSLFPDVKPGVTTASDVYSFASVCLEVRTLSIVDN